MSMRDVFKQVAESKATNKGDFIKSGRGQAVIVECLGKETGMPKVPTFIARVKVISSESKGELGADGKPLAPNAPGSEAGWIQKFDKLPAMGATKAFVLNVLGVKESETNAAEFTDTLEQVCSSAQPMRGMLVNYDTYEHITKDKKKMTLVSWSHVPQTAEEVKARRAELDKTNPIRG